MKVSFIFSREELAALLQTPMATEISEICRQFCDEQLTSCPSDDVTEGLLFRKMARKVSGQFLLEPVIHLVISNLRAANECRVVQDNTYLFQCPQMVVRLEPYLYADGDWKLTPYESEEGKSLMAGGKPWPDCLST